NKVIYDAFVTLSMPDQIECIGKREDPTDPFGGLEPIPYPEVIIHIIKLLKDKIVVCGEADKALTELRLKAREVDVVELCRNATVR
ncbi:hypothetical protein NL529_31050, partial [Klebsiella pneumoniae]|nr:hypothetical protein [Klebsiella pneumoniae]